MNIRELSFFSAGLLIPVIHFSIMWFELIPAGDLLLVGLFFPVVQAIVLNYGIIKINDFHKTKNVFAFRFTKFIYSVSLLTMVFVMCLSVYGAVLDSRLDRLMSGHYGLGPTPMLISAEILGILYAISILYMLRRWKK